MSAQAKPKTKLKLEHKLQLSIQGGILLILMAAQLVLMHQFEQQILGAAKMRAQGLADGAINGLNTLMITKMGSENVIENEKSRELFIKKMGEADGLLDLHVFHGKQLDEEYGKGLSIERPQDDLDKKVLETGESTFDFLTDSQGRESIRTVMPFIATKNLRGTNCLKCHEAKEGEVLGATSVTIDISKDEAEIAKIKLYMWIGQLCIQFMLYFLIRYIIGGVVRTLGDEPSEVVGIAQRIAEGNLSVDIHVKPNDTNSLLFAMQTMQNGLRQLIGRTIDASSKLAGASHQLSVSSNRVLEAVERQSDITEQIAATIEQNTTSIASVADNATQAEDSSKLVGELARESCTSVTNTVAEMNAISQSVSDSAVLITALSDQSKEVSKIVNTIKEIADQTNLLALNAAIEAARAGEQGRGFAVVADEVRKLAEHTAKATREITIVIDQIQVGTKNAVDSMTLGNARVTGGVKLVQDAGVSMERINEGVKSVLLAISDISTSLSEQSIASNHIATSVEGITRMSDTTHTTVKEVSDASLHLEKLSLELSASAKMFKI